VIFFSFIHSSNTKKKKFNESATWNKSFFFVLKCTARYGFKRGFLCVAHSSIISPFYHWLFSRFSYSVPISERELNKSSEFNDDLFSSINRSTESMPDLIMRSGEKKSNCFFALYDHDDSLLIDLWYITCFMHTRFN